MAAHRDRLTIGGGACQDDGGNFVLGVSSDYQGSVAQPHVSQSKKEAAEAEIGRKRSQLLPVGSRGPLHGPRLLGLVGWLPRTTSGPIMGRRGRIFYCRRVSRWCTPSTKYGAPSTGHILRYEGLPRCQVPEAKNL